MQPASTFTFAKLLFSIFWLLPFQSFSQSLNSKKNKNLKVHTFQLTGNIKGLASGTKVFIRYNDHEEDSVVAKENFFEIKGTVIEPTRVFLLVKEPKLNYTSFWIENSKITLEGHIDSLRVAKVRGSKTQDLYVTYVKKEQMLAKSIDSLKRAIAKLKSTEDQALKDSTLKAVTQAQRNWSNYKVNFIKDNPSSFISGDILNFMKFDLDKPQLELLFKSLSPNVKNSVRGKQVSEYLAVFSNPQVGKKAPSFEQYDSSGIKISLDQFKGKYVLLDFWGSWCVPCLEEMPNLVKMYNQFRDQGFEIVAVAADINKETWLKSINKYNMNWINLSELKGDQDKVILQYGVNSFPDNFLIDPNGMIKRRNLRGVKLQQELDEIFKSKNR